MNAKSDSKTLMAGDVKAFETITDPRAMRTASPIGTPTRAGATCAKPVMHSRLVQRTLEPMAFNQLREGGLLIR